MKSGVCLHSVPRSHSPMIYGTLSQKQTFNFLKDTSLMPCLVRGHSRCCPISSRFDSCRTFLFFSIDLFLNRNLDFKQGRKNYCYVEKNVHCFGTDIFRCHGESEQVLIFFFKNPMIF